MSVWPLARSTMSPSGRRLRTAAAPVLLRIGRRLGELILVAVVVVILTTLLIHLAPGNPARVILGLRATPAEVRQLDQQLGLDHPVIVQIQHAFTRLFHGDLGTSVINQGQPVSHEIGTAAPITGTLILGAMLIAIVVGVPLGLLSAVSTRRTLRQGISTFALLTLAVPPFVLALLLLLGVSLGLHLAPAGGWGTGWPGNLRYAWLPSLALAGLVMPQILRTVRQTAQGVLSDDFIEAAQSRGLSPLRVTLRHVLPNSLLPVISVIGLNAAALIAGAVVVEAIFGMPGLGGLLQSAVENRDYPVIQGVAIVTALAVILINMLTDIILGVADPRIRSAR